MAFEDFKIDTTTGDVYLLETGYFGAVSGLERVAQACKIRLGTHKNEWLLDVTSGVDWTGVVLVKNPRLDVIRAQVVVQLNKINDVKNVVSVEIIPDYATRTVQIDFTVNTPFGLASGVV